MTITFLPCQTLAALTILIALSFVLPSCGGNNNVPDRFQFDKEYVAIENSACIDYLCRVRVREVEGDGQVRTVTTIYPMAIGDTGFFICYKYMGSGEVVCEDKKDDKLYVDHKQSHYRADDD